MNGKLLVMLVLSPALLPLVVEAILIRLKPTWFAWLAFGSLGEHAFAVPHTKAEIDTASGYREGLTKAALPALPEEIEYADIRLISQGSLVMLQRRRTERHRRVPLFVLIRIDARRDGDTITLRARRVLAPVSLALAAVIFCAMCATSTANFIGAIVMLLLMSALGAVSVMLNGDPRKLAHEKAFRRLEREYRRLLEEPTREASEVR
jgi:hypothetical protein